MTQPYVVLFGLKLEADGEVTHCQPELWDENGNLKEQENNNG